MQGTLQNQCLNYSSRDKGIRFAAKVYKIGLSKYSISEGWRNYLRRTQELIISMSIKQSFIFMTECDHG